MTSPCLFWLSRESPGPPCLVCRVCLFPSDVVLSARVHHCSSFPRSSCQKMDVVDGLVTLLANISICHLCHARMPMFCVHIRLEENRTCSRLRGLGFGEVCAQQRPFAHSRCQFLSAGRVLWGWMHLSVDWKQGFAAYPSSRNSDARRSFLGHIVARTVFYSCCCHDSTDTSSVRWLSKESRCVTQVFESGTALGVRRTFTGF